MTRILYYLIIKPLSLLPLRLLYLISNLLFLVCYYLLSYRKSIVVSNLKASFPEKNKTEIKQITRKFYHFFCDFIVESLKCFSISEKQALDRCKITNPEILDNLYRNNKSIVLASGHYNNWEMAAACLNLSLKHQAAALYKPLSNKFFNKKFIESRSKFGIELIPKKEGKDYLKNNTDRNLIIGFGCDQCPKKSKNNLFWTRFLNQDTAIMFGTEKYAIEFNYAVIFMNMTRVKRGYYEIDLQIIEENPCSTSYGEISKKHTQLLEEQIRRDPAYWLWTHKRWKLKRDPNETLH
ncbi:KDO2-lipid IV(A) lauroyltransferase [Ancylomarina subtilis]|uniref:KDO2-lipid IV(A) lauroyltransferase n=1 Tax=Ancylomarina subtilis TaxID=1639035 RepID=A0A4Q7VHJ6_9BACT|nr:lysophospholipid acyltransferase family protein [Ancylomarina subtilis]RZT95561.1 KDO2-lipid IV(A) lauroyltransferase [Ancylomarina subtilis]